MMNKLNMGYDDNLGIATDFAETINCDTHAYHDLSQMIADFNAKKLQAIFIPAGTLPYLEHYTIVAQSLFTTHHRLTLQSNFVSAIPISVQSISEVSIGRVNQYCTTSYWAPMIKLMSMLPSTTTLHFKNANSFQDMLHKTAIKEIDCAMVWDIILKQNPLDTIKVHKYFSLDNLPSPIIVSNVEIPTNTLATIQQFKSHDLKTFFPAFQKPDMEIINAFIIAMEKASTYFKVIE